MAWPGGLFALLSSGVPDGLSFEQRKRLYRFIQRRGLAPALVSLQRARLLGGAGLGRARELLAAIAARPLIFIISYHKTGTRSVHEYLERLGLLGLHWPVFVNCGIDYANLLEPYVGDRERCVTALAPVLARFDFFGDVPFPGLSECLAETFPNSRFIAIDREPEQWWDSVSRHWDLPAGARVLTAMEAIQYGVAAGSVVTLADRDRMLRNYCDHLDKLTRVFAGSDRLLRTRLDAEDIGPSLSRFVGVAQTPPFPHVRAGAVHRTALENG